MDVISYEYTKQRKEFGRHPTFSDSKPECLTVKTQRGSDAENQWIERNTTTVELDCIPEMAEHSVNTERFVQCHKGMLHTQGAWPKDVKTNDVQDKERFLRRIENLPQYTAAVKRLTRVAEKAVQQNNSIDLHEQYFASADFDPAGEPPSAKTCCVFRDPSQVKRAAVKMCWHPDGAPKIAVAYSMLQFQQMPDNMPVPSYIWDVNSPNEPDFEILPQSALSCLVYNPRNPDQLVGGSYNGLVGFWDLRKGKTPVESSVIEKSHHDPVYDIFWIQSRTGNECCSVSTDGQILWWDVRKLDAGPTDSMYLRGAGAGAAGGDLSAQAAQDLVFGGMALDYRSDAGATRYLLGTEQGQAILVDRKAKKDLAPTSPNDSSKSIKTIYGAESGKHHGPIYSVQRHPYAPKYFMTVGDWTSRIWMEDIKTPIMTTRYDSAYLTAGCWSPTRPGVFFTTKVDGTLDIWDYVYKQSEPVFSSKLGDHALCSIKVHNQGKLVAVGSQDGSCTILEIGDALSEQQPNEKQNITQMFERETKREKNLEIQSVKKRREAQQQRRGANLMVDAAVPAPSADKIGGGGGGAGGSGAGASGAAGAPGYSSSKQDEKTELAIKQAELDFFKVIELKDGSSSGSNSSSGAGEEQLSGGASGEALAAGELSQQDKSSSSADLIKSRADAEEAAAAAAGGRKSPSSRASGEFKRTSLDRLSADDAASRKALDDGRQPADA